MSASMSIMTRITSNVKSYLVKQSEEAMDDPKSWVVNLIMKLSPENMVRWIYSINHYHPAFVHHLVTTLLELISNFLN
jgi:hypothetical protein